MRSQRIIWTGRYVFWPFWISAQALRSWAPAWAAFVLHGASVLRSMERLKDRVYRFFHPLTKNVTREKIYRQGLPFFKLEKYGSQSSARKLDALWRTVCDTSRSISVVDVSFGSVCPNAGRTTGRTHCKERCGEIRTGHLMLRLFNYPPAAK